MALPVAPSPVLLRCKGVLFDMDGILISSLGSVERSWTKWAEMRGIDPDYALQAIHGRRAIDSLRKLRPDLDAEEELKLLEQIEIADTDGLTVLPGVRDLIDALPGNRWTVVTSATEKLACVRLAAGGVPVPDRLVTAERVTNGKPHPEPFQAGAAVLGFAPGECVVFEDSASGVKAARAAGCIVIATTFSHPMESLGDAHYVIEDLTDVAAQVHADEMVLSFQPIER